MPLTFNIKRREGQNYSTTNNCELLRTCVTDVAFYKNKWMHTALQRAYSTYIQLMRDGLITVNFCLHEHKNLQTQ